MIYILILVWGIDYSSSSFPRTSVVVEFNSLKACQDAGQEIIQYSRQKPSLARCVAKGMK